MDIKKTTQAKYIVSKFANVATMASVIAIPEHTIRNWLRDGFIPQKYHVGIIDAAERANVVIQPYDFVAYMIPSFSALRAEQTAGSPASLEGK